MSIDRILSITRAIPIDREGGDATSHAAAFPPSELVTCFKCGGECPETEATAATPDLLPGWEDDAEVLCPPCVEQLRKA